MLRFEVYGSGVRVGVRVQDFEFGVDGVWFRVWGQGWCVECGGGLPPRRGQRSCCPCASTWQSPALSSQSGLGHPRVRFCLGPFRHLSSPLVRKTRTSAHVWALVATCPKNTDKCPLGVSETPRANLPETRLLIPADYEVTERGFCRHQHDRHAFPPSGAGSEQGRREGVHPLHVVNQGKAPCRGTSSNFKQTVPSWLVRIRAFNAIGLPPFSVYTGIQKFDNRTVLQYRRVSSAQHKRCVSFHCVRTSASEYSGMTRHTIHS